MSTPANVICPNCKATYQTSTVERRTDLDREKKPYYDVDGSMVPASKNIGFICSNGHRFLQEVTGK